MYRALTTTTNPVTVTSDWAAVTPEPLLLYTLDDGQRDFVYDWGRIKYLGQNAANVGYIVAIVDYFTHGGGTGPFTVNSYANTLYATIPTYRSIEDAAMFNLRDCLDFRPARIAYDPAVGDSYTTTIVSRPDPLAVPGTQVDLSYYLPRIDRVYAQTTDVNPRQIGNKFRLDVGTSSINPKAKEDVSDRTQQLIATLISPPYTGSASDVQVIYPNYERYTMKDIGGINDRLNELEKRVKRQGIDIVALNNKVFDRGGIQGNVLYTTGIFVEDFSSHDAALTASPYFTATINTEKRECRPAFSAVHNKLFFIADPDVSYRDDLITMPFTEQPLTSQTVATGFSQVNSSGASGSGGSNFWPLVLIGAGYYAWRTGALATAGALPGSIGLAAASLNPVVLGIAGVVAGFKLLKKLFSDERLKENINKVGTIDGINVYTFNYKWDKTQQEFGVMAHELLNTKYADAVSMHESGYYMVDYGKYEPLRKLKGF